MISGMVALVKALWAVMNGPNNDPVVVGLLLAVFGMMSAIRAREKVIKAKDDEIKRLVEERNVLHQHLLGKSGTPRKSTKKGDKK